MKSRILFKSISKIVILFLMANLVAVPRGLTLPEDPTVQAGDVTFTLPNGSTLNVNQASERAIIDWIKFCIANGETVNFMQPGSSSIALNRVTGGSISEIFGALNANGQVWLINPNGIIFGRSARINAAGFLASTLDIRNEDFMNRAYTFTQSPDANGYIINRGQIAVKDGGYVTLLGQAVHNEGVIYAKLGKVVLAAGEQMTLQLDSEGMISVAIDKPISEIVKGEDGSAIQDAVLNTGTIDAEGGTVMLTASVLKDIFENAVNNEGIIKARSLVEHEGKVYLIAEGGDAASVNTGVIDVSAAEEGADGGTVEISGDRVTIDGDINMQSIDGEPGTLIIDPVSDFWIVDGSPGNSPAGSTVGEEWLENFTGGSVILQAVRDVLFLIGDNELNLQHFDTNTETFRVEAGRHVNLNDDSIVTQGGNVELFADFFGGSDGTGDVYLGIGNGITTNGGDVTLSGANVFVTAPVNTVRAGFTGGAFNVAALGNVLHGPRGDVMTGGGAYTGAAGNDYIFMLDADVDTGGGAQTLTYGGDLIIGSSTPQTEHTYAWEYVSGDRDYLFKEFGYYYYSGSTLVYVPLVKGYDIGRDGDSVLSGAGVIYDTIGEQYLYTIFTGYQGETLFYHQDPALNDGGLQHVFIDGIRYIWEDIIDLGDRDYNDAVMNFMATHTPYYPDIPPPTPAPVSEIVPAPLFWDMRFKIPKRHLTEDLQITYTKGPIELLTEQIYFYHPLVEMGMYEMPPLGMDFYEFIDGRIDAKNPALLPIVLEEEQ